MSQAMTTRRFSVEEYHRLGELGVLHEDERLELIKGAIVEMAAIGSRNMGCVNRLHREFNRQAGDRFQVSVQNPVRLPSDTEPEPDIALLRPRADDYTTGIPGPEDVLLIVEVADSSLGYDRDVKLPRYAAAGVPEVWLFDLTDDRVERYGAPEGGRYRQQEVIGKDTVLAPQPLPGVSIAAGAILK